MSVNKVLNNIPQSLTTAEKQQARDNIDAAKSVSVYVPANTGWSGDLSFKYDNTAQTFEAYVDNHEIGSVISTPTVTGTYLTCDENGTVIWEQLPTPKRDVFMESEYFDESRYAGNIQPIKAIACPTHNGKYPTKIIGSFYCNPQTTYDSISVIPLTSAYVSGISSDFDFRFYENSQNVNIENLNALTDSDTSEGKYSNTITFQFHKNPNYAGTGEIAYIGIKGKANSTESNYNPHNISLTYFYESDD